MGLGVRIDFLADVRLSHWEYFMGLAFPINKILSIFFKGIYKCHNDEGGNKNVESAT